MNSALTQPLATTVKRILMIKLRHHGDMLLTTPVVNTLKQHYPGAHIDVLLYQETSAVLSCHPDIATIFVIDRQWKKRGIKIHLYHEWHLIQQLRRRRYDLVLNLADQWRSAVITLLTGAGRRLGFDWAKRQTWLWRCCHSQLVSVADHGQLHTVEQNLSLLAPLAIASMVTEVTMYYGTQDWQYSQQLLASHNTDEHYIVIHPGSRWLYKCWNEEKMAEAINLLQSEGYSMVITAGPAQQEQIMIDRILSRCMQARVISLAGQLTLCQLAAIIDHARLFIGVDSVAMHMAAALKTPCIALFGSSKLSFWHPWQAIGTTLWAGDYGELPDPDTINTDTDERYLNAIPVSAVVSAARHYLS